MRSTILVPVGVLGVLALDRYAYDFPWYVDVAAYASLGVIAVVALLGDAAGYAVVKGGSS